MNQTAEQVREAKCLGCGCTDSRACPGRCYWLRVNRAAGFGVCSSCPDALPRYEAMKEHRQLTKKIHEHGLMLEDVILIGASVFSGGMLSQAFGSMCDMYDVRVREPFPGAELLGDFDANEFAEWLIDSGFDGFLCMVSLPCEEPGVWRDLFFYGDSIDACIDQAIAAKASV